MSGRAGWVCMRASGHASGRACLQQASKRAGGRGGREEPKRREREGRGREGALRSKLRSRGVQMRLGGVLEGRGERGLGGEVGRSVDVGEGEGHACQCRWGPAPHPRGTGASSHKHWISPRRQRRPFCTKGGLRLKRRVVAVFFGKKQRRPNTKAQPGCADTAPAGLLAL